MPEVRTQEDYDKAILLLEEVNRDFWLGGSDLATDGDWLWNSLNDPVNMTQFWINGQPVNDANRNCIKIRSDGFYNGNCEFPNSVVCENIP